MGTWNAFYVKGQGDEVTAAIRQSFPDAAMESSPAFVGVRRPDEAFEVPEAELRTLSTHLNTDVIWLSFQSAVDAFQFRLWRAGQPVRSLIFGCDGEERTWDRADGAPQSWEAEVLFDEEELRSAIEFQPSETARQELKRFWRAREIVPGRTDPPVDSKDAARGIAAHYGLPHYGLSDRGAPPPVAPPQLPAAPAETVFRMDAGTYRKARWWRVGGGLGLACTALGFGLSLTIPMDQFARTAVTVVPMLFAMQAFITARNMTRGPRQVTVGPGGLRLVMEKGEQTYAWSQIGWAGKTNVAMTKRWRLRLYDDAGRPLAEVGDAVLGFEELVRLVAAHIAAKTDGSADRIRRSKARRQGVFLVVAGPLFIALGILNATSTANEGRKIGRLREAGVAGVAQIEDRKLAPNGVTPRLIYRITTPDGRTATRNLEIARPLWDHLADAKEIPVIYVPDEPDISRLLVGEIEKRESPGVGYLLSFFVSAMGLLFVVGGVLSFRGWDIRFDEKTRRFSMNRFGT